MRPVVRKKLQISKNRNKCRSFKRTAFQTVDKSPAHTRARAFSVSKIIEISTFAPSLWYNIIITNERNEFL